LMLLTGVAAEKEDPLKDCMSPQLGIPPCGLTVQGTERFPLDSRRMVARMTRASTFAALEVATMAL